MLARFHGVRIVQRILVNFRTAITAIFGGLPETDFSQLDTFRGGAPDTDFSNLNTYIGGAP